MPSPDTQLTNLVAKALLNENQTFKKLRPAATQSSSPGVKPPQHEQQQAMIKCPRCDSSSTKFCYYNNYSLAQPRHFCKTCRRYWTKGGSLRNVPVGGGSRQTKRLKSSSSSSSSSKDFPTNICGLKLSPALDFQLGSIELPRANTPNAPTCGIYYTEYPALGEGSPSSILGSLNLPLQMVISPKQPQAPSSSVGPPSSTLKIDGHLVSSIESLSSINQDLHWKLHEQRLATLYADVIPRDDRSPSSRSAPQQGNIVNESNSAPLATEWFFGKSAPYTLVHPSPTDSHSNDNTRLNSWHHSSNNTNNDNSNNGASVVPLDHTQGWGC